MPFITKLDYSNNRQIKQFDLSTTQLSGTTVFGVSNEYIPENFSGDTINVDALQNIRTRGLIFPEIIPVFTGNTYQLLGRDNATGKVVEVSGGNSGTTSQLVNDGETGVSRYIEETDMIETKYFNLVIGGVGSIITTPTILISYFTNMTLDQVVKFSIVGGDVYARLEGDKRNMIANTFKNNGAITSFIDTGSVINGLGNAGFENANNLIKVQSNATGVINGTFEDCNSLNVSDIYLPNLSSIQQSNSFENLMGDRSDTLSLPSVITITDGGGSFKNGEYTIEMPNLLNIKTTSTDKIFENFYGTLNAPLCSQMGIDESIDYGYFDFVDSRTILNVGYQLETSNSGGVNASIQNAINQGATVNYIGNFIQGVTVKDENGIEQFKSDEILFEGVTFDISTKKIIVPVKTKYDDFSNSDGFLFSGGNNFVYDVDSNPSGTKLLVGAAGSLTSVRLSKPFDLQTIYDVNELPNVKVYNSRWNIDGTKFIINGGQGNGARYIKTYSCGVPYSIGTITLIDEVSVSNGYWGSNWNVYPLDISDDGTKIWVLDSSTKNILMFDSLISFSLDSLKTTLGVPVANLNSDFNYSISSTSPTDSNVFSFKWRKKGFEFWLISNSGSKPFKRVIVEVPYDLTSYVYVDEQNIFPNGLARTFISFSELYPNMCFFADGRIAVAAKINTEF